ncbi:MAG: hypothetical protein ABIK82_01270 [Pseudomonadota bacterium]
MTKPVSLIGGKYQSSKVGRRLGISAKFNHGFGHWSHFAVLLDWAFLATQGDTS